MLEEPEGISSQDCIMQKVKIRRIMQEPFLSER